MDDAILVYWIGVPAVDHHVIAHIDPHMACPRRIVSPLEKDQVSRLCFRRGNLGTVSHQSVCSLPADIQPLPQLLITQLTKPEQSKLVDGELPPHT